MNIWITAFVGVGSNLESPLQQAQSAIAELKQHKHLRNVSASALYGSKPVGPQDQPDYINAVVQLETRLGPHDLLDLLQSIENTHGRVRKRHWGERTLDLDLLLYGTAEIHTPRLTVPHPYMLERSFVLYPLAELCPKLVINNKGLLSDYLSQVKNDLYPVKNGN